MSKLRNVKFRNSPAVPVRSVSAAYTIDLNSDYVIAPNTTAASRTITLPPIADAYDALSQTGREFIVFKPIAANSVVVEGNAAETINGAANQTLTTQYSYAKFIAGATEWMMVETDLIDAATLGAGTITGTMLLDGTVDSDDIAAGAIDLAHMSADSVDSAQYVDGSIDPVHIASTSVAPAGHAACAILNTTTEIRLTIDDATNVAISTTSAEPGQRIKIVVDAAAGGGSYTLAVAGGTLTFNSDGETAVISRNTADSAWDVEALTAGIAGGNPATVV